MHLTAEPIDMLKRSVILIIALACITMRANAQQPAPANAADVYRQAIEWWVKNTQGDARIFSDDEVGALSDPVTGAPTDVQRSAHEKAKPYIDLMRTAGRTEQFDLKLDYNKGFDLLLPHLAPMRNATRLLRLDAQMRMLDGDSSGAIENLQAVTGIGRHARTDDIVISSLVSASIMSVDDALIGEALARGVLDPSKAGVLAKELEPFRTSDPLHIGAAIRNESTMLTASVEQALDRPNGMAEMFATLAPNGSDAQATLAGQSPDEVRAQVANYNSLMQRCAEAATNPDRDAARKAVADIQAAVARGDEGPLAQVFMPAVEQVMESSWRITDKLAARLLSLEEIRDGKRTPASFANAAYAYLWLAALVDDMPEEAQRDIEAARVAHKALDPNAIELARRHIGPMRERLQRDFRIAARCGLCDFSVRWTDRPTYVPAYLAALRGAARVALADSMVGASPRGSDGRVRGSDIAPAKPAETIAWILTLSRHLASDPAIGHSLVASTLLADTSVALDDAMRARALSDTEVATLRDALNQFDAIDPIAMRHAAAKERALIERSYGVNPDGSLRIEPLRQAMARRDASALASILFTFQFRKLVRPEDGVAADSISFPWSAARLALPLNGVGDLIDASAVATEREATATAPNGTGAFSFDPTDADAAAWDRMFATFTLKPCDVRRFEAKATSALAAMNDLVKEKASTSQ